MDNEKRKKFYEEQAKKLIYTYNKKPIKNIKREPSTGIDILISMLEDFHESLLIFMNGFINSIGDFINSFAPSAKHKLNFPEIDFGNDTLTNKKHMLAYCFACIIADFIIMTLLGISLIFVFIPTIVLMFLLVQCETFVKKILKYTITILALVISIKISIYILGLDSNGLNHIFKTINNWGIVDFYKDSYDKVGILDIFKTIIQGLKEILNIIF